MADSAALVFALDARIVAMERALARAEARAAAAGKRIETTFANTNKKVTAGLTQSVAGLSRFGAITGQQRFVIQNTANQFGDLAVQIAAGTSATRALGQQLPQLLGGFGALGGTLGVVAPILGTIAAIGIPLAGVLYSMASASDEAADKADTLEKRISLLANAVGNYADAAKLSSLSTQELREEYGLLADTIKLALDAQTDLRRSQAEAALSGAAGRITGSVGDRQQTELRRTSTTSGIMREEHTAVIELQSQLQATREEALRVFDAINAVGDARGTEELVIAMQAYVAAVVAATGSLDAANKATEGVTDETTAAVIQGGKLLEITRDVALAAGESAAAFDGIAGAISNATYNATALVTQIRQAASAVGEFIKQQQANVYIQNAKTIGAYQLYGDSRRAAPDAPVVHAAKRGGGGGRSNLDKAEMADLAKAKSLFESTRTAAEQYAIQLAEVNRLHAAGKIDAETAARAIEDFRDKMIESNEAMGEFRDASQSAFVGFVTGAQSAGEAISQLLAKLAEMAASSAFENLFSPPAGGGGGFLSNLFGGLFGGRSFAGGGYTGGGTRSGGLDGQGGFMAMVHPRETIVDNSRSQSGGRAHVTVDVRGATGNSEVMTMVRRGITAGMAEYDRSVLPGRVRDIGRDPRRRG